MKKLFLALLFLPALLLAQSTKPSIAILGVTHSGQLINTAHQPAALRAFIHLVRPDALLIERSPEEFSRSDFYEFTYEQQYVIVPFAAKQKIQVYPVDWLPKEDDVLLAFGVKDLEVPAFVRNASGFWGFTSFDDSSILTRSLYYAEDSAYKADNAAWYTKYPATQVNFDMARRLFLYRTFMQAKRIQEVAKNYGANDTLLVMIGDLHKADIESNLANAGYRIINTTHFGNITNKEIQKNYELLDAYAIASFNLLGLQSRTKVINQGLLQEAMSYIKDVHSPEASFFDVKYKLYNKSITSKEAINKYETILKTLQKTTAFTWNGVKHKARLDSYTDPFGNMTLWQRLHLELAREYFRIGDTANCNMEQALLLNELQGLKKAMLLAYWPVYIEK